MRAQHIIKPAGGPAATGSGRGGAGAAPLRAEMLKARAGAIEALLATTAAREPVVVCARLEGDPLAARVALAFGLRADGGIALGVLERAAFGRAVGPAVAARVAAQVRSFGARVGVAWVVALGWGGVLGAPLAPSQPAPAQVQVQPPGVEAPRVELPPAPAPAQVQPAPRVEAPASRTPPVGPRVQALPAAQPSTPKPANASAPSASRPPQPSASPRAEEPAVEPPAQPDGRGECPTTAARLDLVLAHAPDVAWALKNNTTAREPVVILARPARCPLARALVLRFGWHLAGGELAVGVLSRDELERLLRHINPAVHRAIAERLLTRHAGRPLVAVIAWGGVTIRALDGNGGIAADDRARAPNGTTRATPVQESSASGARAFHGAGGPSRGRRRRR